MRRTCTEGERQDVERRASGVWCSRVWRAHWTQQKIRVSAEELKRVININVSEDQRRNQDGGVEGRALIPSCENTRITTSCWTIIDRKILELTKKDTPHPKTKEKPQ